RIRGVVKDDGFDLVGIAVFVGLVDRQKETVASAEALLRIATGNRPDESELDLIGLGLCGAEPENEQRSGKERRYARERLAPVEHGSTSIDLPTVIPQPERARLPASLKSICGIR